MIPYLNLCWGRYTSLLTQHNISDLNITRGDFQLRTEQTSKPITSCVEHHLNPSVHAAWKLYRAGKSKR
jgi:hypothetical protein